MNLQDMRKDITRLIDDVKYHSDSLTPEHQLPIIQLNIILAKMNKMVEKTIILKHHLEMEMAAEKIKQEEAEKKAIQKEKEEEVEAQVEETVTEEVSSRDVGEKLKSSPIPNLKSAIGIYERYLFANELFNGNIEAYDEAIAALNEFDNLDKANYYIKEGLVKEFKWDMENEFVNSFCSLVQRRYDRH